LSFSQTFSTQRALVQVMHQNDIPSGFFTSLKKGKDSIVKYNKNNTLKYEQI